MRPKSDTVMSRTVSSLVKTGWTEEEVLDRTAKMKTAVKSGL